MVPGWMMGLETGGIVRLTPKSVRRPASRGPVSRPSSPSRSERCRESTWRATEQRIGGAPEAGQQKTLETPRKARSKPLLRPSPSRRHTQLGYIPGHSIKSQFT